MTERDHVDDIVDQWRRERPDLDLEPMPLIGRVMRLGARWQAATQAVHAEDGLQPGWFDVLASLRRSGPPFELSPGRLAEAHMLSSGGMTKRLDRLQEAGLVERRPDPDDRRGIVVALTPAGRTIVDRAVERHLENERRLVAALTTVERLELERMLRRLLIDGDAAGP